MKLTPHGALAQLFVIAFATATFAGPYSPEIKCHQALMAYGKKGMNKNGTVILPAERFGKRGVYVFTESTAYFEALPEEHNTTMNLLKHVREDLAKHKTNYDKAFKRASDLAFEAWGHANEAAHLSNLLAIRSQHPELAADSTFESEKTLKEKLAYRIQMRDKASAAHEAAKAEYKALKTRIRDAEEEIKDLSKYEYPGITLEIELPKRKAFDVSYMVLNKHPMISNSNKDTKATFELSNFSEAQDGSGREKKPLREDILSAISQMHSTYLRDANRNSMYRATTYRQELIKQLKTCNAVKDKRIRNAVKQEIAKFGKDDSVYEAPTKASDGRKIR